MKFLFRYSVFFGPFCRVDLGKEGESGHERYIKPGPVDLPGDFYDL